MVAHQGLRRIEYPAAAARQEWRRNGPVEIRGTNMRRRRPIVVLTAAVLCSAPAALASDAATSATAGSRPGGGTAAATAHYEGDVGFARTNTRSGAVNIARGVAVGFDEDGLSLSVSNAVATRNGPAVATNFNLSIDRDGDVSHSSGIAVARGPVEQSASAGGSVGTGLDARPATSVASGRTDLYGSVYAATQAQDVRVLRSAQRDDDRRVVRPVVLRDNERRLVSRDDERRIVRNAPATSVRKVRAW